MSINSLQEIERAIGKLEPHKFDELCAWFDQYEHSFDAQIKADLTAGRLDDIVRQALSDERTSLLKPQK